MSKKTHRLKPKTKHTDGKEIAVSLLKVLREFTIRDASICEGRISVTPKGKEPVACSFATYPTGDYVVWFNDKFKWHLWALVNEKLKHAVTVDDGELETLLAIAQGLDKEIRKKL